MIRNKGKIRVFKAIRQSGKIMIRDWQTLLLFSILGIAISYLLEMILSTSGFTSFLGGLMLGQVMVDSVKVFYVLLIIMTTSNVIKERSIKPMYVMKSVCSRIIQIIFQGIICSAALALPSAIILVLIYAITESQTLALIITSSVLGLLCVKLIFSAHGVLIDNLDGLEGIKESLSITNGSFLKLYLTLVAFVAVNFGIDMLLDFSMTSLTYVDALSLIIKAFVTICQVTLITSMYHQAVRRMDLKDVYE